MAGPTAREQKLTELLTYFQGKQPEYTITRRLAPLDEQSSRFDFIKSKSHFMLDLTNNFVDDTSVHELKKTLETGRWWDVLQSHPEPDIVLLSSTGFSFTKP
jgi:hypothetical protein